MRISKRVWVVTGAGSGMGRELVLELLRREARVAAVDLRPETLQETADIAGAGDRLTLHVLDVTDQAACAALPDAVIAEHGQVDGVINNAGIIQPFLPVGELDDAAIDRVLDVNLMGTLNMVRAFLPVLRERPEAYLANVASMGGFFPFPGQTVYGASKAAVKLLTEGLYAELMDTTVHVSVVLPGAVRTNITGNSGVAVPGTPEAAAQEPGLAADAAAGVILAGIERNRLHIFVGRDSRMLNLAIRAFPRRSIEIIKRQMEKMLAPAG